MRRLTEILDVPKAWYKRRLFQRIFLGKEATYAAQHNTTAPQNNRSKLSTTQTPEKSKPPPLNLTTTTLLTPSPEISELPRTATFPKRTPGNYKERNKKNL